MRQNTIWHRFVLAEKALNITNFLTICETLLKRDSNTGLLLWNLPHFSQQLLWRTPANNCSWISVANCQNTFLRFLTCRVFNPFTARFSKYVWPFYNIMHERVNFTLLLRNVPISMTGACIFVSVRNNSNSNKNRNWNS